MIKIYRPNSENGPVLWNWITLIGPDAQDFLHRLTTVHAKALQVGQGKSGCFLTAQGKIRAYFTLWHYRPTEYAFEFDAGSSQKWKSELLSAIDQYTFGEKITLADPSSDLSCVWIFPEEAQLEKGGLHSVQPHHTSALDEEIRICNHGTTDYGRLWFTAWGRTSRLNQWVETQLGQAQEVSLDEIETWRISALRPRVDAEISQGSIPLEVGLRDTIADNKGCYPGQEVIEKIIALGSPPKRLVQIQGKGVAPEPGSVILNLAEPPAEVGQVTSVSKIGDQFTALGLVRKIHAKEGLEVQFSGNLSTRGAIIRVAPYGEATHSD